MKKLNWKYIDKIYLVSAYFTIREYDSLEECQSRIDIDFIKNNIQDKITYKEFIDNHNYYMYRYYELNKNLPLNFYDKRVFVDENFLVIPKNIIFSNIKKNKKKKNYHDNNFRDGPIFRNGRKWKRTFDEIKKPYKPLCKKRNNVNYRRNTDYIDNDEDLKEYNIKYRKKKMLIDKFYDYDFFIINRGNNWKNYRKKQYKRI